MSGPNPPTHDKPSAADRPAAEQSAGPAPVDHGEPTHKGFRAKLWDELAPILRHIVIAATLLVGLTAIGSLIAASWYCLNAAGAAFHLPAHESLTKHFEDIEDADLWLSKGLLYVFGGFTGLQVVIILIKSIVESFKEK